MCEMKLFGLALRTRGRYRQGRQRSFKANIDQFPHDKQEIMNSLIVIVLLKIPQ
jgi:hypothetical protein